MRPGRLDLEKIDDDGNIESMQAGKKNGTWGKIIVKGVCALNGWAYIKKTTNGRWKHRDAANARIWFHAK